MSARLFASVILLLGSVSVAQQAVAPLRLPNGVAFPVRLNDALDVRRLSPGDSVVVFTTKNLLGPGGVVAIPKGAKITGKVLIAEAWRAQAKPSRLAIRFQEAKWKNGSAELNAFFDSPVMPSAVFPDMPNTAGATVAIVEKVKAVTKPLSPPQNGTVLECDSNNIYLQSNLEFAIKQYAQ